MPAVQTLRNRSDATKSHALRANVGQQFLIPYGALLTPCVLIGCSIMAASFMVRAYRHDLMQSADTCSLLLR